MPDTDEFQWSIGGFLELEMGGINVRLMADSPDAETSDYQGDIDFIGYPTAFSDFLKKVLPEETPSFITSIDIQKISMFIRTKKRSGMDFFGFLGDISIKDGDAVRGVVNILFYYKKNSADSSAILFSTRYNGLLGFSGFPLVGEMLPAESGLKNLQLIYSTGDIDADTVAWLDEKQAEKNRPLLLPRLNDGPTTKRGIPQGISFSTMVSLGENGNIPLHLSTGTDALPAAKKPSAKDDKNLPVKLEDEAATAPAVESQEKVEKPIGKLLHIKSFGTIFNKERLGVTISGGLRLAVFELDLMGLEVTVPIDVIKGDLGALKKVAFDLKGLGLNIKKGPITIAGAFLRSTRKDSNGNAYEEYAGMVQLGFKSIQLAGIGAYANYEGNASLFLFAYLGYPIGGPPPFFITGLAVGFGINRRFVIPAVDKVASFPLIRIAAPAEAAKQQEQGLGPLMESLHQYLPPSTGDYFLVAGIHFESFGIIKTQALLAVKFGNSLEISLLGISRLKLPAIFIELQFLARFIPAEGIFMAEGQLTSNSYIFSSAVRLTGGFAVGFWFSGPNAGDFVISIGGYHPQFRPPPHYPTNIPRLGISWQISREMSIKGEMYFALTPQAIMAGIYLEASYNSGSLYAFLKISADFIIYWKPFYYEAQISIAVGVRVNVETWLCDFRIDVNIQAGLRIWGPDFSGEAYLDIGVKVFKISFGANAPRRANPISWLEFKESFLPASPVSIAIGDGLLNKVSFDPTGGKNEKEIWLVNPKDLTLITDSVIPATKIKSQNGAGQAIGNINTNMGIAPMDVKSIQVLHEIVIKRETDAGDWVDASDKFSFTAVIKNVPKALWGQGLPSQDVSNQKDSIIKEVLSGFEIKPTEQPMSGTGKRLDANELAYNLDRLDYLLGPQPIIFQGEDTIEFQEAFSKNLRPETISFFEALGLGPEYFPSETVQETEVIFKIQANPISVSFH